MEVPPEHRGGTELAVPCPRHLVASAVAQSGRTPTTQLAFNLRLRHAVQLMLYNLCLTK
jgi:hypothetical protein